MKNKIVMKKMRSIAYCRGLLIIGVLVAGFVLLQFTSPVIVNPPATKEISAPEEVSRILKQSCYDCHSNAANPAWYGRIAPVSFLVAHDINEGRSRFNFSEWDKNPPVVQELLLWEMVNAIEQGEMPLARYSLLHSGSRVSAADLAILKKYVNSLPGRHKVDTARIIKPTALSSGETGAEESPIPVSPNGVPYYPDYKNWRIISITDKYDGGSMRVVYANDIMYKAIKSNKMPFPDGSKMVKAVWGKQQQDSDGIVRPGNFQNVQVMVKDSKKYAATEGWGFAKFDGLSLKPYGKTAIFDRTCINCHRLLAPENDFVFNVPTK
jgi:mono/diheme cytochrome c family protein